MKRSLYLILSAILACSALASCSEAIDDFARKIEDKNTLPMKRPEDSEPTYQMYMPQDRKDEEKKADNENGKVIHNGMYSSKEDILFEADIPNQSNSAVIHTTAALPLDGQHTFILSSGVSHWSTEIKLDPDGTFTGGYYDYRVMEIGDGYDDGTLYLYEFSGRFTDIRKVSDTEYTMTLTQFTEKKQDRNEWTEDNRRFVVTDDITGFDLTDNVEYRFYLPDHPASDLPEEFLTWAHNTAPDGTLGWTALHDTASNYAFVTR